MRLKTFRRVDLLVSKAFLFDPISRYLHILLEDLKGNLKEEEGIKTWGSEIESTNSRSEQEMARDLEDQGLRNRVQFRQQKSLRFPSISRYAKIGIVPPPAAKSRTALGDMSAWCAQMEVIRLINVCKLHICIILTTFRSYPVGTWKVLDGNGVHWSR